jgi:hypothetical protein
MGLLFGVTARYLRPATTATTPGPCLRPAASLGRPGLLDNALAANGVAPVRPATPAVVMGPDTISRAATT